MVPVEITFLRDRFEASGSLSIDVISALLLFSSQLRVLPRRCLPTSGNALTILLALLQGHARRNYLSDLEVEGAISNMLKYAQKPRTRTMR